jgi:DNA recombination protein RmuC
MEIVLGVLVGAVLVGGIAVAVWRVSVARRPAPVAPEDIARRLAEEQRRANAEEQERFRASMLDQLSRMNHEVMTRERQIAATHLDARKEMIDQRLEQVTTAVRAVDETVHRLEEERKHAFGGLQQQLRMLHEAQETLRTETGNLVTALRNPSTRGRWGEMQLRRAIEMAGMVRHCDFTEQTTVTGDDGRLRPDVVVRLPGSKQAVVDAKVPLHAYLEAVEATDDTTQRAKLRDHARQVRTHIDQLASKAYWSQFPEAPDFVVMFVPGDQLLAAAFEHEPALMEHAIEHRVLIATPVTLIALLRSIAYGWQQENLAENARQIAAAGRTLHDRLGIFAGHLRKVGTNLDRAIGAYNEAVGSYEARVVPAARKLSELDVVDDDVASLDALERRARPVVGAEPAVDYVDEPAEISAAEVRGTTRRDAAVIDLTAADADDEPPRLALEA